MKHLGNLTEDQIIDFKFSTHQADGTPITLAGTPVVKVYKANATDSETATGVTLSVDFDGVTGLHNVRIDTSADAFYAVANDYSVVITTGTVDGTSVVGTVLATFSIENRFQEADVVKWLGTAPLALASQRVQVDERARAGGAYKIAQTSGTWTTAGIWADGVVPSAGDNIIVRGNVTVTITSEVNLGTFGTLELQGNAKLNIGERGVCLSLPPDWTVFINSGTISTCNGVVNVNYGAITTNASKGIVNFNQIDATVGSNQGRIKMNLGAVTGNWGFIDHNYGTVGTNSVGAVIYFNSGTIETDEGLSNPFRIEVDASNTAVVDIPSISTKTDQLVFVGGRVKSISPPTSGMAGTDDVFMFSLSAAPFDSIVWDGGMTDDSPGVLTLDRWKITYTHILSLVGTQWLVSVDVLSHDPAWTELIGDPVVILSSNDEAVATVDAAGIVHYVADGMCVISGESEPIGTSPACRQEITITNTHEGPMSTVSYSYTDDPGSVREDATAAIDERIAMPGKVKAIYSIQDHATPIYTRNVNCWAAELDLTCISPWNSYGLNTRAGTLISPRHLVWANHYSIPNETVIRFVGADNSVVVRSILNSQQIGTSDLRVGVLDSDVVGCSYAKVLPDNWTDYIPSSGSSIPVLILDQEEKALVVDISSLSSSTKTIFGIPMNTTRLSFYETIVSGDSGNPVFLVIDDQLVILTVLTYGGAGSGTAIHEYKTEIEAAMVALGGGYSTLTEIDLDGFNTYT